RQWPLRPTKVEGGAKSAWELFHELPSVLLHLRDHQTVGAPNGLHGLVLVLDLIGHAALCPLKRTGHTGWARAYMTPRETTVAFGPCSPARPGRPLPRLRGPPRWR